MTIINIKYLWMVHITEVSPKAQPSHLRSSFREIPMECVPLSMAGVRSAVCGMKPLMARSNSPVSRSVSVNAGGSAKGSKRFICTGRRFESQRWRVFFELQTFQTNSQQHQPYSILVVSIVVQMWAGGSNHDILAVCYSQTKWDDSLQTDSSPLVTIAFGWSSATSGLSPVTSTRRLTSSRQRLPQTVGSMLSGLWLESLAVSVTKYYTSCRAASFWSTSRSGRSLRLGTHLTTTRRLS